MSGNISYINCISFFIPIIITVTWIIIKVRRYGAIPLGTDFFLISFSINVVNLLCISHFITTDFPNITNKGMLSVIFLLAFFVFIQILLFRYLYLAIEDIMFSKSITNLTDRNTSVRIKVLFLSFLTWATSVGFLLINALIILNFY